MDTLTLLTSRRSQKKLGFPTPNKEQLEQIFQAALRAPDHGKLKPYQFVVIEKEGLVKLGNLLLDACEELQLDEKAQQKAQGLAPNTPMMIVVIAKIDPNIAKVPDWEQLLCAGSATYAMQLAANSLGFDNVWLTGKWLAGSSLRQAFNCGENDKIIALLKIGTAPDKIEREIRPVDSSEFVTFWE